MEPEMPLKNRPISGTEYSWYKAVPTGTGITVLALHLSRPIPLPLLQSTLHKLLNSHPVLTSSLTPTSLHLVPTPSPPPILTIPLPPRVPSLSLLHSVLERELNLNPWVPPPQSDDDAAAANFHATLYEGGAGPDELAVLALRFHTAVCDRTSAVAILKGLLGLMTEGEDVILGDGEVNLGIEELIKKEDRWKPFWARGKDLVGYSVNGLRSSGLRFVDAGGPQRRSEVVRLVMSRDETKRLLHACEVNGVKLCGAISAAGLIATYSSKNLENGQSETYSLVTLVDCRKFLDPVLTDQHVGFYHSAILNTHTIHGGEGLWEVAMRCHNAYSTAKTNKKHLTDIEELNFLMCKAIDNPRLTPSSSLRTAVISVFEEPVIYEHSAHSEVGVEDYIGCASVHGVGPSVAIFDTIRDGQLDSACVYPSPLHSRQQMTELVEHMKQILVQGCCDVDDGVELKSVEEFSTRDGI